MVFSQLRLKENRILRGENYKTMVNQTILQKMESLPANLQQEIVDFIEFLLQKYRFSEEKHSVPKYGSLKGTFEMTEDFDEPLEDFKEYM